MLTPQPPENEPARLRTLQRYKTVLDRARESLDSLTRLAATICEAPIAMVSIVEEERQCFPSRVGIDVDSTPRDVSFCAHGLDLKQLFVVPDATEDERFRDNPLVTGEPGIRFYAGAPLRVSEDVSLGALCVIDRRPRQLNETQLDTLQTLAGAVVSQLELQRALRDLDDVETMLPICAWCRSIKTETGQWEPLHDYVARTANVTHGVCPACRDAELARDDDSA